MKKEKTPELTPDQIKVQKQIDFINANQDLILMGHFNKEERENIEKEAGMSLSKLRKMLFRFRTVTPVNEKE